MPFHVVVPEAVTVAVSVPDETVPVPIESPLALLAAVVVRVEVQLPTWPIAKSWSVELTEEPDERVLSTKVEMHSPPKFSFVRSIPPSNSSPPFEPDPNVLAGECAVLSVKNHGLATAEPFVSAQPLSLSVATFVHVLSPVALGLRTTLFRSQLLVMQTSAL